MSARQHRDFASLAVPAGLLWLAAYLLFLASGWRPGTVGLLICDAALLPIYAALIALAWRNTRLDDLSVLAKRGWWLIGASFACAALGDVIWTVIEVGFRKAPYPSIADVAYLSSYPLCLAGLLAFPTVQTTRSGRLKFWLDAAALLFAGAIVLWSFVLPTDVPIRTWSLATWLSSAVYPVLDLMLLVGVAHVLLRRPREESRAALYILVGALLTGMLADPFLSDLTLRNAYDSGSLMNGIWGLSATLALVAADVQYRQVRKKRVRGTPLRVLPFSLAPYLAVGLVCAVLLYAYWKGDQHGLGAAIVGALGVTGLVVARQIVTLRENANLLRELAAQAARFRALVQRSSDVVIVVGLNGVISDVAASVQRAYGYEPDSLVGRPLWEIIHPDDQPGANQFLSEAARAGLAPQLTSWRVRHHSGAWLRVETVASNLLAEPSVQGIVLNSRDVTDREILEDRVRRTQKVEAVGRLAGRVAHDFNNVLTVIRGNVDFTLSETPEDAAIRPDLLAIRAATEEAAGLVRQLLSLGRKQHREIREADFASVVRGMEPLLRQSVPERIRFECQAGLEARLVRVDPALLQQIVLNLVTNAVDAVPGQGEIHLEIGLEEFDFAAAGSFIGLRPGAYATLQVRDSGEGMDEDVLARLFDPFFTTKPPGKGTGLGLFTVQGIVSAAGGQITVDSSPGRGTTVAVIIPLATQAMIGEAGEAVGGFRRGSETILVVDDEGGIRNTVRRVLQRHGYTVLTAANGIDALSIADTTVDPIHVLVTDMVMPEMGGTDLIRHFRARYSTTPVICMSGYTQEHAPVSLDQAPIVFLQKPFGQMDLSEALCDALDRQVGVPFSGFLP